MTVCNEIEQHIAAVEALYRPFVTGSASRLRGGNKLWAQFTAAVAKYQECNTFTAVIERINELAVARIILNDPTHTPDEVFYEPRIAANDRRIDS